MSVPLESDIRHAEIRARHVETWDRENRITPQFLLSPEIGGGKLKLLCCPVCSHNYVHLSFVRVEQGKTEVYVTGDQATMRPTDDHYRRGSKVVIGYKCEEGHAFEYGYKFHKGNTVVTMAVAPATGKEPGLWRD